MSRNRNVRWIIPGILAAFGLAWTYSGRAQDPNAGQKVGAKVDDAIQDIKGGLRKVGDAGKEQFAKARTSVHNMGVESRVYGRIHWDKALNDASIELATGEDGVITMNGTVGDPKAKARAGDLARETVGVTKVVDQLAIRPAATTTAP